MKFNDDHAADTIAPGIKKDGKKNIMETKYHRPLVSLSERNDVGQKESILIFRSSSSRKKSDLNPKKTGSTGDEPKINGMTENGQQPCT